MKIKFNNLYETIWSGHVDKILSYDTDKHEFTVMNIETNETRKHMTPLDMKYVNMDGIKYSHEGRYIIEKYIKYLRKKDIFIPCEFLF